MITSANGIPTLHAALDAEQQVVGALVIQPERIGAVAKLLQPRDFADPYHRELFDTLTAMHRGGVPIDVVTVKQRLDRLPLFQDGGSSVYLAETGHAVAVASNCDHHAGVAAEALGCHAIRAA